MEWEDFKDLAYRIHEDEEKYVKTKIKCPMCGEYIYRDNTIVLTTFPAQYRYFCRNCDWSGHA